MRFVTYCPLEYCWNHWRRPAPFFAPRSTTLELRKFLWFRYPEVVFVFHNGNSAQTADDRPSHD
jgi:hypothetical protein